MTKITKQVNQGDSVSIQATPNTGYQFSKWTDKEGTTLSTSNPYTFTPSGDTDIKTVFTNIYEPLVYVSKSPNHTLTIKNNQGQTRNLNVFQGTNRYYGTYEGFTIPEITDIYVNNPTSSTTISETDWLESIDAHSCTSWINIGRRNFAYCTSLETVILPNSIAQIGSLGTGQSYSRSNGPFSGCSNLSNINIPTSCQIIHTESFYGCSLGSIVIPGSMLSIYSNAFNYAGLSSVVFQEGVSTLGSYAFMENPGITTINLPTSLTNIGTNPFLGCSGLGSIRMTANSKYKTETNNLIDITNSSIIVGCKNSTIPTSGVNKIGEEAFDRMILSGNLNLSIPGNITKIGRSAFYECTGLSSISFSSTGLTTLLGYAFYGCTGLSSITLPSTFRYFGESTTNTGGYCFGGCTNLATVYMNSISTPPTIYRGVGTNSVSISLFPSTIQKIYVKPGTMSSYQADTNGWDYWYNQKKLYIGIGISSDVSPSGSSTVSTSSNSVEFQSDSAAPTVRLTATPNTGYTFSSWNRGNTVLSNSNPYTATVVDDGTGIDEFTALSTVASYSISASVNPSGGGTVSGTGTYSYGDSCTVSATSNTGYDFVNWTEGGSTVSSNASYTFTVSSARTLVANFELERYTISASPNTVGWGTITGTGTYSYGDSVSLVATAATGYTFKNWTENGTAVSTSSTYTFTATQDRTLVANFQLIQYTISAEVRPVSTYGTVSGTGTKNYGSTASLRATPNTGYKFSNWKENGSQVSTSNPYSFTVNRDRSLWAVFTANTYTISASVSPSGSGTVSGAGTKSYGTTCTLVATANSGYEFVNWTQNGSEVSTDASYSFTVSGARTLVANFQQIIPITITTTGSTTVYLKNNSDQTYTWNLTSGTNTYSGNVSGFELSNLKSIYKYSSTPSASDYLITSIDISGTSITNISERSAWGACRGLTSVIFPETITTFGREAFWNCSALANITLPASVSSIGRDSFNGCTGLSYIRFKGSTVPSFLSNSFSNTNNCTIYVPSDAVDTYKAYSSIAARVQAWPY